MTPDLRILRGVFTEEKTDIQQRDIKWMVDRHLGGKTPYLESVVIEAASNAGRRRPV